MSEVKPFLMFEGKAEDAINLYTSTINNSEIISMKKYGADDPTGVEGQVERATFTLDGQAYMAIDSGINHGFTFTPSFSLFVTCDSEAEVERIVAALSEGGSFMMPLGEYPFSPKFAWFADQFGVSWQIYLEPAPEGDA